MISSEDTSITTEQLKPLDDVLRDWEVGAMDAAGTIEDLVALIESLSSPSDETLRGALEEWRCTSCDETFDMSREPHVCPVCRSRDFEKLTRTAEPTDDVVERVARAICETDATRHCGLEDEFGWKDPETLQRHVEQAWSAFIPEARAALSALPAQGEMQPSGDVIRDKPNLQREGGSA